MVYGPAGAIDVTPFVNDGQLTWQAPKGTKKKDQWRVTAVFIRYGVMKVKRAAPGGEGLVIDHFDRKAVANYLSHIEEAFERTKTPYPHTFFNDSYEVSEATWTPTLFEEFEKRRGYKLEECLPELRAGNERVVSDYRETLGDLLLENFTEQWTAWAHQHGAITRNQAHGSPANLIDCYAAVDIPEIEGFGLSDFGIKGLRTDPGKTRKNDSDYSMFKYAPSAAHVCGKPYTSSETFTWLTEHFRTSLSQLKPDLDLMFCAGVNHMFFHGTCYSPQDDAWPGWKFYASIDMSPTNSIWRDAPYFMQYVERCQSFLQWGQPDNDFLVLLPVRDMWQKNTKKLLMQFSIHAMGELAPEFIKTILDIDRAGFDCDYISERLLMDVTYKNGMLVTKAGTRYKGLIIPGSGNMPEAVSQHITQLKAQGAHVFYQVDAKELNKAAKPEVFKTECGLKAIRRKNETGYHYFMANLTPNDVETVEPLAVDFKEAVFCHRLTQGGNNIAPHHDILFYLRVPQVQIPVLQADAFIRFPAAADLERQCIVTALAQHIHTVRNNFNVARFHLRIFAGPFPYGSGNRNNAFLVQSKENLQNLCILSNQLCAPVKVPQHNKCQISADFAHILNPAAQAHLFSCVFQPEFIAGMCSVLHFYLSLIRA